MNYTKVSAIIPCKPPYFIGSQIRGALGYALKRVVCINPSFKCDECFAKDNCIYYEFYEERNVFHKYRLDFELGGEFYDFSLYLFEDTIQKLPYIISAFVKLFEEMGLGADRKTFKEYSLFVNDSLINENSTIKLPKDWQKEFQTDSFHPNILIRFVTPLRIKKENRFVKPMELELKDIANSIYQRALKLQNKEFEKLPFEPKGEIVEKNLRFQELNRYSNRQKTKMKLGGTTGEIKIKELDKRSYELLKLGEIIGVGKQTVFGLGKIVLTNQI